MISNKFKGLFTSESVSGGHPDKVADRISDSVLDACLKEDPASHVACEVMTTTGTVIIAGEITTKAHVDYQAIARKALRDIGYTNEAYGISADSCGVSVLVHTQSPDINNGVNTALEVRGEGTHEAFNAQGAGDQGLMFGFACNETKNLMPLPIDMAHALIRKATELFKSGVLSWARPDMKSQVTVEYNDGKPVAIDTIVMAIQHEPDVTNEQITKDTIDLVINPVLAQYGYESCAHIYVNSSGRFVVGGPNGDCGLTGRKIIVDTYGGYAPHGGGAFSGKDPSKVDRSGAYMARWIAKTVVAAGYASACEVQLAYAIGKAEPVSINLELKDGRIDPVVLLEAVKNTFDCRPKAIEVALDLRSPIYAPLTEYGHLGREDLGVKWESYSKVEELKSNVDRIMK